MDCLIYPDSIAALMGPPSNLNFESRKRKLSNTKFEFSIATRSSFRQTVNGILIFVAPRGRPMNHVGKFLNFATYKFKYMHPQQCANEGVRQDDYSTHSVSDPVDLHRASFTWYGDQPDIDRKLQVNAVVSFGVDVSVPEWQILRS
jgi:hypothetical protein